MHGNLLKEYLEKKYIAFDSLIHPRSFTAQETANNARISGKKLAKTVVVKVDGKLAMAVLAAPHKILFDKLRREIGAKALSLATESEFKEQFIDCEAGAMPPFGSLYNMETYLDHRLAENEEIYFTCGTHTELVRMSLADYMTSARPLVTQFSSTGGSQVMFGQG